MLTFDDLILQQPLIHSDRTTSWAIHHALAEFLDRYVEPETTALETGAGLSTLVILRKGPRLHVAVQPVADEFAAIVEFANEHEIDTRRFRGVVARSQHYLPTAELPALDLVLIDGDHSFPIPFVDWYYTADRLKVGGLMIVDDIHIATGAIIAAFMGADPNWEEVVLRPERFAIFRKLVEPVHLGVWLAQPFLSDGFPTAAVRVIQSGVPSPEEELRTTRERLEAIEVERKRVAEELATTRTLFEATRGQRDQAVDELATTRTLFEATRGQRDQAVEELAATRTLFEALRVQRDQVAVMAQRSQDRISAMESTKFWKLRRAWFRLRRLLALPGNE